MLTPRARSVAGPVPGDAASALAYLAHDAQASLTVAMVGEPGRVDRLAEKLVSEARRSPAFRELVERSLTDDGLRRALQGIVSASVETAWAAEIRRVRALSDDRRSAAASKALREERRLTARRRRGRPVDPVSLLGVGVRLAIAPRGASSPRTRTTHAARIASELARELLGLEVDRGTLRRRVNETRRAARKSASPRRSPE